MNRPRRPPRAVRDRAADQPPAVPRTTALITPLRRSLRQSGSAARRKSGAAFFREPVKLYGVTAAELSALARHTFREMRHLPRGQVFAACEVLWRSGYLEEAIIACHWSYAVRRDFARSDFPVFERWVRQYVTNWAACDTLCNHTVGELLDRFPALVPRLARWTRSPNRWLRRAAAVSLIVPARHGRFLPAALDIAGRLLHDPDDMVQKGYGWLLKSAADAHRDQVFSFVMKHRGAMPRTALRYAIEKMPAAMRRRAMA